jgi:hypothetical protein
MKNLNLKIKLFEELCAVIQSLFDERFPEILALNTPHRYFSEIDDEDLRRVFDDFVEFHEYLYNEDKYEAGASLCLVLAEILYCHLKDTPDFQKKKTIDSIKYFVAIRNGSLPRDVIGERSSLFFVGGLVNHTISEASSPESLDLVCDIAYSLFYESTHWAELPYIKALRFLSEEFNNLRSDQNKLVILCRLLDILLEAGNDEDDDDE